MFILRIILFISLGFLITACASGTYTKIDGSSSNLNQDRMYCKSLARSKHPGYICKNPIKCEPSEFNLVINDLTQYNAVYQYCMLSKGYHTHTSFN